MVDGQVGFHRPQNVRRMSVEKNNPIVNALNKTKVERHPDLQAEQQARLRDIIKEKKALRKQQEKQTRVAEEEKRRLKEELSYDRVMTSERMTSNSGKFFVKHILYIYKYASMHLCIYASMCVCVCICVYMKCPMV